MVGIVDLCACVASLQPIVPSQIMSKRKVAGEFPKAGGVVGRCAASVVVAQLACASGVCLMLPRIPLGVIASQGTLSFLVVTTPPTPTPPHPCDPILHSSISPMSSSMYSGLCPAFGHTATCAVLDKAWQLRCIAFEVIETHVLRLGMWNRCAQGPFLMECIVCACEKGPCVGRCQAVGVGMG